MDPRFQPEQLQVVVQNSAQQELQVAADMKALVVLWAVEHQRAMEMMAEK